MAQFTAGQRPPLAGAYFDFEANPPQPVIVNTTGVAAIPFTHNWGPANQVVPLNSFSDFVQTYGDGGLPYTPGYIAVRQAFDGEGLPGRGGAARVLAYRIVHTASGSPGVAATVQVQNTAVSPAAALTVTAKYPGTFGNRIAVTLVGTPGDVANSTNLNVLVNGQLAETFTYPKTNLANLAAQISDAQRGSRWINVTVLVDGTALALSATGGNGLPTPTALVGGVDGSALTSVDWTNLMTAFSSQRFAVFAPFDLTDSTILASLATWGGAGPGGLNALGKRCEIVTGGASGESATGVTSATSRAVALDDPNIITIGVGSYNDTLLGPLSTSQLAPRLAGIVAARGGGQGLTFARLTRLQIVTGPTDADILTGIQNGFMTLGQDSNADAPVRFEKGVTTYTDTTTPTMPVSVFGNPKFMLTMHRIERDITEWANSNVIGIMPVNDGTVAYVIGYVKNYLNSLAATNLIQPGFTVTRSPIPVPTSTDDFIALTYQITFGRDVEQVLGQVIVG